MDKKEILELIQNENFIRLALFLKCEENFEEKLIEVLQELHTEILSSQSEEEQKVYIDSKIKEIQEEFLNLDEEQKNELIDNFKLHKDSNEEDQELQTAIKNYEEGNIENIANIFFEKAEKIQYLFSKEKKDFESLKNKVREYFLKTDKERFFKNNRRIFFKILRKGN